MAEKTQLFNQRLEEELNYTFDKFLNPSGCRRVFSGKIVIDVEHSRPVKIIRESKDGSFRDEIDL